MEERLLRLREVENMTGMTRSTIYRKMPLGRFPRPYRLGEGGGVRWKKTEVDAVWLRQWSWCATITASGHIYAMRREKLIGGRRRAVMLHRAIMSAPPGMDVDHVNGDTLDCRRVNLRLATRSQNAANRHREIRSFSRFRGVSPNHRGGKWRATITHQGRRMLLGSFDTEEAAAAAYNEAAVRMFGEFASPNHLPEREGRV